jgi:hypothetical protein
MTGSPASICSIIWRRRTLKYSSTSAALRSVVAGGYTRTDFGSNSLAAYSRAFSMRAGIATIQSSQVRSGGPVKRRQKLLLSPYEKRTDRAQLVLSQDLLPLLVGQLLPFVSALERLELPVTGNHDGAL